MLRNAALSLASASLFAAIPTAAQETGDAALDAIRACRDLTEDAARLACYDRATGAFIAASESGEIELVDRQRADQTRKELFGFAGASLPFFDDGEELKDIESTITGVRRIGRDGWQITIEDGGAVWQIIDPPMRFNPPRVGDRVKIERGALTSYFIQVRTQIGVKGKRVQ